MRWDYRMRFAAFSPSAAVTFWRFSDWPRKPKGAMAREDMAAVGMVVATASGAANEEVGRVDMVLCVEYAMYVGISQEKVKHVWGQ
jgi:hypothetical protein